MARRGKRRAAPDPAAVPQRERTTSGSGRSRARARRRGRRIPWLALGSGLAVIGLALVVLNSFEVFNAVGERVGTQARTHIADGATSTYSSTPPTAGAHWTAPAPWGISSTTVPDQRAVHNLEHKGIVIAYNAIPEADVAALRSFVARYPRDGSGVVKILVHPYDRIAPGAIVATAWGWLDRLTAYDEARLRAFTDAHIGRCCE